MGKCISYTAEFKVKIMKFTEQNRNCPAERGFSITEAHIHYWRKQKEELCIVKCSARAFWGLKNRKILEFEEKLFKYFKETQNSGNTVSHEMPQLQAYEIL
jgi:hypothetical protein